MSRPSIVDRPTGYKQQKDNPGVTEILEMPNRGHALTIDSGWCEVCDKALAFVQRFVR
jgi:non-heme chloroperoxidase